MTFTIQQNIPVVHWDKALIEKYDCRGPRYTSYPTATEFNDQYTVSDYEQALRKVKEQPFEPLSVYLHIPFCHDICYYCACNKIVTRNQDVADTYLNYLEKEMRLIHNVLGRKRNINQLHLGGGTPTFLNPAQMTRLIHMLSTYFQLSESDDREYSIEIDPRTVTPDTLALLKGLGFNRISLGVQDFSPQVQQAINRVNPVDMVEGLMVAARNYGYTSINFDLIYGLPHQTAASLKETIESVIALSPDRIAFYNYAHLPERFTSQRAIDRMALPDADEKLLMLNTISDLFSDAGYVYIGMDHFVKPEDPMAQAQRRGRLQRNFQGYSIARSTNMLGLGVSSISSVSDTFAQNCKEVTAYYEALDNGVLPIERGVKASEDDKRRAYVIMHLISNLQLSFAEWEKTFGDRFSDYFAEELNELDLMQQDALVEINAGNIEVLAKGRSMLRNICMVFDIYHSPSKQLYSKVI
ncbi:Oxygen-independent coproporphyrinogen III oxidase [BD1-7 clade bacterium]|uniref:Coproporphyrinogen-III oxidase n=1 Tax=BD1-7 clade bacterium TaxID=2029982 RepID=A0A5S9QRY9_9GAMM|nr:Oxygen-independent coproporphyrinogen III oxidase [BD1-7 clade bacterium]CAA0121838.1 Oxygen-independent coproporphyrinogen III oxidase [BD1-7 clade bacterium]